jgi:Zn-dependent peptidase ImmA (M78 family)
VSTRSGKSATRAATDLSQVIRAVLGDARFPIDVEAWAFEVSRQQPDPIETIQKVAIDGFDGMLRLHPKREAWQILYAEQPRYPGRERFTLAHEFGHYLLHRKELLDGDGVGDAAAEGSAYRCLPLQMDRWKVAEEHREDEADTFACHLLMPFDDYRAQVGSMELSGALLTHVTDRYGVSLTAAVRRWIEFTDSRAVMLVARDGYALWGRASKAAFRSGIFVRSGMEIPEESLAGLGRGGSLAMTGRPTALPAGIWTFARGSEPVKELTIISERLGVSLTILQFEQNGGYQLEEDDEPWDSYDQFVRASGDR